MSENQKYWFVLTISVVIACSGWIVPSRMPIDYHSIVWTSLPLGIGWVVTLALSLWRFGRRGFWLLAGAPLALYWPVWLLFNRFPSCYYSHNCV